MRDFFSFSVSAAARLNFVANKTLDSLSSHLLAAFISRAETEV
jgi:hypothetical protein